MRATHPRIRRNAVHQTAVITAALATMLFGSPAIAQTSVELTAAGPEGNLAGTLLSPEASQATVVIVPGSGPTDRDGNNPLGVTAAPYRLLAEALAEKGVATLRIDKRGMFGSKAALADANAVTISDYATDLQRWTTALRARDPNQCVFLLGHSEGGLVALEAMTQVDDLCGVILVATPGRPIGDIMRDQFRANPANAPLLADALSAVDTLERGETVDVSAFHPALQQVFAPQVQPFLIDMMRRDPTALASQGDVPMLIVHGGRDIQATAADAAALRAARPDATYAEFADMTHVLKDVASDDRMANLATYTDASLPLADGLADSIAEFVRANASGEQ